MAKTENKLQVIGPRPADAVEKPQKREATDKMLAWGSTNRAACCGGGSPYACTGLSGSGGGGQNRGPFRFLGITIQL